MMSLPSERRSGPVVRALAIAGLAALCARTALAGFCVQGDEYVNPTATVYPWTRVVVYFNAGHVDTYANLYQAYIRYTYDNSTWQNTSGKLAEEGEVDDNTKSWCNEWHNWRVKGHIPAPGRNSSSSNFKFTYYGSNAWDAGDWRDSNYDVSAYVTDANSVQWNDDGAHHDELTQDKCHRGERRQAS